MVAPLSEITAIIRDMLRDDQLELGVASRFDELPGWDAMDLIAVVVEIECRLNLQFELAEIDRLGTIGDLLAMIKAKQALASA